MAEKAAFLDKKTPQTVSLKTPSRKFPSDRDVAFDNLRSFCKANTSSLKTAGMRFLSTTGNRQQATGNRQQATGNRQQATGNRQQATGNRQQATGNRQQATANYKYYLKNNVNYTIVYYLLNLLITLLWKNSTHKCMCQIFYITNKFKGDTK